MGEKVIEKIQNHCHANVLVFLFHYKQMVCWGFSCALHSNLKYNCLRVHLRDTWSRAMSSFSFCFALQPSNAMSSEGLHCSEQTLQSSVPVAFSRAQGHSLVTGWFCPLFGAVWSCGVQLRPQESMCFVDCCVTSLWNWYSSFLHFQWTRNLKFRTFLH